RCSLPGLILFEFPCWNCACAGPQSGLGWLEVVFSFLCRVKLPGPRLRFYVFMPDTTGHMRVLKVVQSYFPFQERGGPVFKVRALAPGLAKRGHQVTVVPADLGFGEG